MQPWTTPTAQTKPRTHASAHASLRDSHLRFPFPIKLKGRGRLLLPLGEDVAQRGCRGQAHGAHLRVEGIRVAAGVEEAAGVLDAVGPIAEGPVPSPKASPQGPRDVCSGGIQAGLAGSKGLQVESSCMQGLWLGLGLAAASGLQVRGAVAKARRSTWVPGQSRCSCL